MSQILVQFPDGLLDQLEKVAPGSARRRSRFIQLAVQKALIELDDSKTQEAYRRMPDVDSDWFDARVWDEWKPTTVRGRTRRSRRK
jgi:hypothetical protein